MRKYTELKKCTMKRVKRDIIRSFAILVTCFSYANSYIPVSISWLWVGQTEVWVETSLQIFLFLFSGQVASRQIDLGKKREPEYHLLQNTYDKRLF